MNSVPLVSIVIPAFNPRFFRAALDSALAQTWSNLEIIVCDDCQTGEIKAVFDECVVDARHPVRYLANPQRLGFQANMLKCLEQAGGEFIKFLCDDDVLYPHCVAMQADALQRHTDVGLVVSRRYFIDQENYVLPERMENMGLVPYDALFHGVDILGAFDKLLQNNLGGFSAALMRRDDAARLLPQLASGGEGFSALLDFALFICLLRHSHLIALNAVSVAERIHPDALSQDPRIPAVAEVEKDWLRQMMAVREEKTETLLGWTRFVALRNAALEPREWDEVGLYAIAATRQGMLRNRVGAYAKSFAELYKQWLAERVYTPAQKKLFPKRIASWHSRPRIVPIVIDRDNDPLLLSLTLDSLMDQDYPPESIVVLSDAQLAEQAQLMHFPLRGDGLQQLNEIVPLLNQADWVYLLRAGDRLVQPALLILAERVAQMPGLKCVYSDEGALRDDESREPAFKPDFNLDLLRSYPYVGRVLAFERQHLLGVGGLDRHYGELAPHDVIWRIVEAEGPHAIEHIAEVLVESSLSLADWLSSPAVIQASETLTHGHLQRLGIEHVIHHDVSPLLNKVEYLHADQPLVSIILFVRDQLSVLERCVESLLTHTLYPHYEVLIVDRGSREPQTLAWLSAMAEMGSDKLRVIKATNGENEAATWNQAFAEARGSYLLRFSVQALVRDERWIECLLNHAQRAEVGVVGPKIVDPQGRVLHAGMVLWMESVAGRPSLRVPSDAMGYMQRLQVAQNWTVLGGHCLMVRRDVLEAIGPLDEATFSDGLNELDLCLRAGQQGYLVVWDPTPCVVLDESAIPPQAPEVHGRLVNQQQALSLKWLPRVVSDPAYNVNLVHSEAGAYLLDPGIRSGWNPFCTRHLPSILGMAVNSGAVGHYRLSQPLAELEAAGRIIGKIAYEMPSLAEVVRQDPDVVVIQGRYNESRLADIDRVKVFSNALRVYELDDYIVNVPAKNEHRRSMPDNLEDVLRRGIGMCDRLVVSTQPLADALSGMHHDIRVVPNMLAPHMWNGLKSVRRASSKPRIGWGGGTSHRGDLELIVDVVRELADEVEWVFFGMCPELLRPYIHEFHRAVPLHLYPAKLASLNLDLALAPLEMHIFNDCKSNLRLLEYGACGYPVVCSNTLAYAGHLPATRVKDNSTEQWLDAVRMHLADPAASYRMGDELRETVLRDFMLRGENLQYWANGWLPD
ncbi:glycosyltransferase [Pseudomonas sp. DTU_2021_1001937_2_SI_NGA_ILE_001]|uniref:glycosyltransferase n=1 Tax=Pseudomonas sp. DTU_2021_1001937_2_SI_NGA_ILE_001 TaxID=3077589 RepID=UPI0028FC14DD|nr:glycosyltransferase [Pseudomonas sp. DTU_2021_1001937_2_SI_NGA_ILE_001]WNW11150.1 glycosyltransferase [Pseudomonas sp. DTU_2021_1001937_2_SI_NGA_ILE_001]